MSKVDEAISLFHNGFNCSQAVLGAFCEEYGLDLDTALRISSGFGGGMGGMGGTCGAVTGAYMVIGLKYGKTEADDRAADQMTRGLAQLFAVQFAERNGNTICRELLKADISTSEGLGKVRELNIFQTQCPKYVTDAVEILETLL